MLPRFDSGIHDDQRDARNYNTAPPIMVSARTSSQDLGNHLSPTKSKDAQPNQDKQKSPEPVLEPPPTPFRDFHAPSTSGPAPCDHAPTPEPLATPAPEDDEEQEALIEYFMKSVH